jgi:E3 ubiquitin-protein ligase SHPRH
VDIKREERIDCVCGVDGEDGYDGLWVQCDSCDAWLHGRCVGIRRSPKAMEGALTCSVLDVSLSTIAVYAP